MKPLEVSKGPFAPKKGPFVVPAKRRRQKPRILPPRDERQTVTALFDGVLDLKLETFCLLERRAKNEVLVEAIQRLLDAETESGYTRSQPAHERRTTVILTEQLKARLNQFVTIKGWSKSDAITLALILFLEERGVNPYTDPTAALWLALKS